MYVDRVERPEVPSRRVSGSYWQTQRRACDGEVLELETALVPIEAAASAARSRKS
jgi:hypothetical protein